MFYLRTSCNILNSFLFYFYIHHYFGLPAIPVGETKRSVDNFQYYQLYFLFQHQSNLFSNVPLSLRSCSGSLRMNPYLNIEFTLRMTSVI